MFRKSLMLRLMMPLLLAVGLVALVLIAGNASQRKLSQVQEVLRVEDRIALQLAELRSVSRSLQRDALNLVIEPDPKELAGIRARFDKRTVEFDALLTALPARLPNEPAAIADDFRATQREVLGNLRNVRAASNPMRALTVFRTRVRPAERHASGIADALITRSTARANAYREQALTSERSERRALLVLTIGLSMVALAIGIGSAILTVMRPLNDIEQAMKQLAGGDVATGIPHTDRADAIGTMARAIEVFRGAARERDTLRSAASEAEQQAEERRLAETARQRQAVIEDGHRAELERQRRALLEQLAGAVEDSLATVNDKLRASADRLFRSAGEVTDHAAAAGQAAERTARAAAQVTSELASASGTTQQVNATVGDMRDRAAAATDAVARAVARSRSAAARIAAVSDNADRVAEVIEVIKTVAHKSRLLALNATIEAARSGEAGRGFSIVANEMKGLAAQTTACAEHVERQVAAIRLGANDGGAALGEIEEAISQIDTSAALVLEAMHQQSEASAEIGRGMGAALANVRQVGSQMSELGATARGTEAVAGTLLTDAQVLAEDAASVDTALRQLIARLKAA